MGKALGECFILNSLFDFNNQLNFIIIVIIIRK